MHGEVMTNETKYTDRIRRLFGRRGRILALLVAVVAAVGIGSIWTGPASSADETQQTAEAMDVAFAAADSGDDGKRAELRSDLKEARKLDGTERREALKAIREDARDGKYGDRIERRADRRGDHRAAFFALLPDELQADLKKARAIDDADDRKKAVDDIRKKALAGDYGDKVKEAWKLRGEHRRGPGHEDS
jgi:hypothetical protein